MKNATVWCITLLLLLCHPLTYAQNYTIDSLKQVWHSSANDTIICKALNQLASKDRSEGWQNYYIELQKRADKGLAQSKDTTFQKFYKFQMYCAKEYAAYDERLKGNNDLSIRLHQEAYIIAQELKKINSMANINNSIAQLYYLKADAKQALDYYERALRQYESLNDSLGITKVLNNIGTVHNDFGEKELALRYFKSALPFSLSSGNLQMIGSAYNNIASVLSDRKQLDEAIVFFLKAQEAYAQANLLYEEGITLNNIGSIYQLKQDRKKALAYFEEGLSLCMQSENPEGIASSYCFLAGLWFAEFNLTKAQNYAEKALALGKEMGTPDIISKAANYLARIYEKNGEYKKAYEMQALYTQMKDSMQNDEQKAILMKSQFQFEYGKKSAADSIKSTRDKEVLSFQLQQQKTQKLFLFSMLGLAILLGGFVLNRYRVTQRQNKIIERNNKDLQRQHLLNQKIFSVISHDFKGPMLSLSLLLNAFKKNKYAPELNPYIEELDAQLNSSNTMMDNLLDWAKTELQVKLQDNTSVRLLEVVNEIEFQLRFNLEAKSIVLEKVIDQEARVIFPSDVLKIVIRNVLSNAIKFSFNQSAIQIIYLLDKHQLKIKDRGVGMTFEKQSQLFKKDVLSSPGTNYENGFGMGLYLVAELLKKHGASIHVNSEMDKGSEFTITFPG